MRFEGKTMQEYAKEKRLFLVLTDEYVKNVEALLKTAEERGEQLNYVPKKGVVFCADKWEGKIYLYECDRRKKSPVLKKCSSFEIGNEDFSGKKLEDYANGRTIYSMTLLAGKEDFEDYPFVLENYAPERRWSAPSNIGFLRNLILQINRDREDDKKNPITQMDEKLLSYPDTKGPYPKRGSDFSSLSADPYAYQLEYLGGEKEIYRLSFVSMQNESDKASVDVLKSVLHKIFIFKENGKTQIAFFVRKTDGSWRKASKSKAVQNIKNCFSNFFMKKGEKDTGFLRYVTEKTDDAKILLDTALNPVIEKLLAFPALSRSIGSVNIKNIVAYPEKKTLEDAFALSMSNIHIYEQVLEKGNEIFCNPGILSIEAFYKGVLALVKSGKTKTRRMNQVDFKKYLLTAIYLADVVDVYSKVYQKDELYKKLLCLSKDFWIALEKSIQKMKTFGEKEGGLLKKVNKIYAEYEGEYYHSYTYLHHSGFGLLQMNDFFKMIEGKEGENLLDALLFPKKEKNDYRNETFPFTRKFLFLDEKREREIDRFIQKMKEKENELKEFVVGLNPMEIRRFSQSYPNFFNGIYKDFIRMIPFFSAEEIDAMGISLKPSQSIQKIEMQHDRLAALYTDRKEGQNDRGILAVKEKSQKLLTEGKKFLMTMPGSFSDLAKEGTQLGHCVASYAKQVARGQTKIFFVREVEHPEDPLCTVEVKRGAVSQIQGKLKTYPRADSVGKDKEIYEFVRDWAEKNEFSMRNFE